MKHLIKIDMIYYLDIAYLLWKLCETRHRINIFISILLAVFGSISEVLLALSTGIILGSIINSDSLVNTNLNNEINYLVKIDFPYFGNTLINIKLFISLFILLSLISLIIRLSERRLSTLNGANISTYLSKDIISKLLNLGYPTLKTIEKPEFIVLMSKGTDVVLESIAGYLCTICNTINILILTLSALAINYRAGLIVILFTIFIYIIFSNFNKSLVKDYQKRYKNMIDKQNSLTDLILTFPREMILMFEHNFFLRNFINNEKNLRKLVSNNTFLPQGIRIIIENLLLISLIAIPAIYKYFFNIPISNIVIISSICFLKCLPYLLSLLTSVQYIKAFSEINLKYLNTLSNLRKKCLLKNNLMGNLEKKTNRDLNFVDEKLNIKLANVCYAYEGKDVLKKINLDFEFNKNYAIVGGSGSGKTTLLDIVSGLERPSAGKVLLNSKIIENPNHFFKLRNLVSYQSQKSFVLDGTILDNILLGKRFDQELLDLSLEVSNFKEYVDSLPKGINTIISKGVKNLSGGQEQRLCLARSIYCNAPILIFDEPTSALDKSLELRFFSKLKSLLKNKIIIVVTHNLNAIPDDFQIYNLEDLNNIHRKT